MGGERPPDILRTLPAALVLWHCRDTRRLIISARSHRVQSASMREVSRRRRHHGLPALIAVFDSRALPQSCVVHDTVPPDITSRRRGVVDFGMIAMNDRGERARYGDRRNGRWGDRGRHAHRRRAHQSRGARDARHPARRARSTRRTSRTSSGSIRSTSPPAARRWPADPRGGPDRRPRAALGRHAAARRAGGRSARSSCCAISATPPTSRAGAPSSRR